MEAVWSLVLWALHVSSGVALGLWWSSYYYCKLLDQEKTWTNEALADTERIAQELESTRKLNVELARERDREKAEVSRLADERKELRQQVIAYCKENREMSDECSHLRKQAVDSDRCQEAFKDLTIHLHDMADTIASVAPNAKGD